MAASDPESGHGRPERESPGTAPETRTQDDLDKWLCERLRELYATGSFWHVSAKLAADRIERLRAERDCALAAFELELHRSAAQGAPVVDCEALSDGSFAPAAAGSRKPESVSHPSPPEGLVALELAPEWPPEITDEEVEAVARILCAQAGFDPEQPVLYRDHKGVRVRREPDDEDAGRCLAMPIWKWRFEKQARAALEAAASARARTFASRTAPRSPEAADSFPETRKAEAV